MTTYKYYITTKTRYNAIGTKNDRPQGALSIDKAIEDAIIRVEMGFDTRLYIFPADADVIVTMVKNDNGHAVVQKW